MILILALAIGVVAGLRAMTAPAAVAWAAQSGAIMLDGSWLAWLGYRFTPWILTLLAVGELISDKLPTTPSRKVPVQFGTRIAMGALSGGAVAAPAGWVLAGVVAGMIGAIVGTLGGAAARGALARRIGRDTPAAVIEDIVAIAGAALIVAAL